MALGEPALDAFYIVGLLQRFNLFEYVAKVQREILGLACALGIMEGVAELDGSRQAGVDDVPGVVIPVCFKSYRHVLDLVLQLEPIGVFVAYNRIRIERIGAISR